MANDFVTGMTGKLNTEENNLFPVSSRDVAVSVVELVAEVNVAPTGQNLIAEMFRGVVSMGTVTILAGAKSGTVPVTQTVSANTLVTGRLNQVGSTEPGETLTLTARGA